MKRGSLFFCLRISNPQERLTDTISFWSHFATKPII
nr:MAG TPA: hypothetical protein [Caudoviricetes sp.]